MDMENIKKVVKESIVQNFMEAAKFARRGAEKQRPKSWSKGTKSGSDKRKMREQGKRDASEMQEGVSPFKRWELQQELKHEDDPNFERNMRQDAELARMDQNAKWSMQRLLPVYEKHGMAEEHAGRTDQYGFPSYGHAITHPNFTAFAKDFIAFHTAENKKHWAEKGKASSFHWPAILRAKEGLESLKRHDEYNAKQRGEQGEQSTGDLSEMYYNRLKEETNDIPQHARVTSDEEPDYYGELERQRKAGTSNEEPNRPHTPESIAKMLHQAHETALSRAMTAYGKGGKHAKQDPFHMIGHYADELSALHTDVMGDASS